MPSNKVVSILNNVRSQIPFVTLTDQEERQVETLCELLEGILNDAVQRSSAGGKALSVELSRFLSRSDRLPRNLLRRRVSSVNNFRAA